MERDSSSPFRRKSGRTLAPNYSSSLIFDKKGQDYLTLLTVTALSENGSCQEDYHAVDKTTRGNDETVQKRHHVVSELMSCTSCQVTFSDREEQKSHYKCDWHRYNLHQKLRGYECISEDDFEKIAEASDVSSISGSDDDSESEEEVVPPTAQTPEESDVAGVVHSDRKLQKVYFRNEKGEIVSLYRCLLHHKKNPLSKADDLVKAAMDIPRQTKWMVVMVSAGHFASAIFHGKEVLEHKTFHRYTVRAKRGTAQSTRDKQGNAPKSAGARLRRYNEAALTQDVHELMATWSGHISACDLIFVRIPVHNRGMFYGGKNPILKKDDARIRVVSFPTRRPTFNEVKRVHQMLASVECYGLESEVGDKMPYSPPKVYVPDIGELQIREPRKEKVKKKGAALPSGKIEDASNKDKEEAETKEALASERTESCDDDRAEEVADAELVEYMQTVDFSHLKEFETSPSKKKKKKKKPTSDRPEHSEENDEVQMQWQNKLFTACKTGNLGSLLSLIQEIKSSKDSLATDSSPSQTVESTLVARINESLPHDDSGLSASSTESDRITPSVTHQGKQGNSSLDQECCRPAEQTATDAFHKSDTQSNRDAVIGKPTAPCVVTEVLTKGFGDQNSNFLHVAAKHSQPDIVWALLEAGTDPALKDKSGKVPYVYGDVEVRNTFRRFMAAYPDKYDYTKAQVPSPLTAEMEAEKKQKNAERRKQKKKALNERNKEKKAVETKEREEKQEKERFLALSDREKRALAAERRLLQHQSEQSGPKLVLSRCWQCATDITGKVPFEYAEYRFCTTKCLREHRSKTSS